MVTSLIYGYADLGRAGLGNMLFPWARCLVWCRSQNVPMLPARWFRLRVGPFLRGERDKRMYHRLFHPTPGLAAVHRSVCLLGLPHRAETEVDGSSASLRPGVYVFRGMQGSFRPLLGHHDLIRHAIVSNLRPKYIGRGAPGVVAIHVRRGDFGKPRSIDVLTAGHANFQIPIHWYVAALRQVRAGLAAEVPAFVFSDGQSRELDELMAEPGTRRVGSVSAATDILTMSSAAALIGSGSTFSGWAAFLGQVPSIWYPGQRNGAILSGIDTLEMAPEWQGGPLPLRFLNAVRLRCESSTIESSVGVTPYY